MSVIQESTITKARELQNHFAYDIYGIRGLDVEIEVDFVEAIETSYYFSGVKQQAIEITTLLFSNGEYEYCQTIFYIDESRAEMSKRLLKTNGIHGTLLKEIIKQMKIKFNHIVELV